MNRKLVKSAICVFFALITVKYLLNLNKAAVNCDGYVIGDWLINYSPGFVRRGLSGWVMLELSELFSVKPNFMVSLVQAFLYLGSQASGH